MNIIATQQSIRHPPMPIWEDVVWQCGNATSDAPARQGIAPACFNTEYLYHLSDVIVRSNNLVLKLSGISIVQIPIARTHFNAHRHHHRGFLPGGLSDACPSGAFSCSVCG
jgi:hypothetical protein